jgi:predicted NACHT family NTPase
MLDWLAVWGVTSAVGLVFKPILEDLAKDATKDWAKDLMKDSLKNVLRLPSKEPVDIAAGKALKEFLQLVQDELEDADLSEAGLKQYIKPLKQFIKDKSVKEILGSAFKDDCQVLDAATLAKTWNQLNLRSLPDEFEWERVAKRYLKKVKALVRESDELRALLDSQKLEGIEQNTRELAGIVTEFDLERYQEGLRERYGNLNLDSLDTSIYDYRERLKVWQIFIAQNVRECQEFLPQVYEIPKEHQKRLRESNQLEAEVNPEEWERYKQIYYQQPVRSVLDVVNEMSGDPPQPPLKRGENLDSPQSLLKRKSEKNLEPPFLRGAGGIDSCRYIVILGDPGSGKSTLLQYIALNWARTPLNNVISQPIPLLIELRTYKRDRTSGQCKDFLEFFHNGSVICRLNQHELHEQLKAGKVLVMFDGLDEVFDPVQREEVITDIHRFTNDYPNVRVIVTSRIIGYKPQRLRDAQFRHFMLQDLESDQIQDFIYRWHELTFTDEVDKVRKRERLQQAIKTSSAIGELAGNPLLLTMMAILNRNQELPRDRPELYNQASRVLLHQWDVEQKLLENPRIDSVAIDYKDKQAMLRQVAYHMQAADKGLAGNLIRGEDLEKILTDYLKSIEVSQARTVARLLIEQLRSRNFILCFLGADSYGFVHRTFLEYFCACEFVERFGKRGLEGGLTLEELKMEVFGKHWQDESWHEVLRLIAGMIDAKFVGEIIEYLIEQNIRVDYIVEQTGEEQDFNNLLLAAKCLSEVRNRLEIQQIDDVLLNHLKDLISYKSTSFTFRRNSDGEYSLIAGMPVQLVSTIGMTWQDNPDILPWLKACTQSDNAEGVRWAAMQELVRRWKDDPDTLPILKTLAQSDEVFFVRYPAMQELAKGWKDEPEILLWVKTCAQSNEDCRVRYAAVQELAKVWKDEPWMFEFLCDRAVNDPFDYQKDYYYQDSPRQAAIEAIVEQYPDHPQTLPLLHDHVINNRDELVRNFLLEALAKGWKDDPETLSILKACVQSDENSGVRSAAVQQLVDGWKDEPWMFDFLCDRALNDPFERKEDREDNPRQLALEIIIKQYRDHPQTLPLLQDIAENDPDEKVREFAREKLAKLEE